MPEGATGDRGVRHSLRSGAWVLAQPLGRIVAASLGAVYRAPCGGGAETRNLLAPSPWCCKQRRATTRLTASRSPSAYCPRRPPAKSACLEGPILEAHIGTLHSPAVSHLLSDTTFPQLGILRVPLFVPVLAGFLLRTNQVRSAPVSNWQPLSHRRYHVRRGHRPKAHVLKVRYWKPIGRHLTATLLSRP